MSIATELTALQGHISNAYDAVNTKGGAIPTNKNMANLDDAILSIPAGGITVTNGIVEQYRAASSTIPANTFVEFVGDETYGEIKTSGAIRSDAGSGTFSGNFGNSNLVANNKTAFLRKNTGETMVSGASATVSGSNYWKYAIINDSTAVVAWSVYDDGYDRLYARTITAQNGALTAGAAVSGSSVAGTFNDETPIMTDYSTGSIYYFKIGGTVEKLGFSVSNGVVALGQSSSVIASGFNSASTGPTVTFTKAGSDVLVFGTRMADSSTYLATAFLESAPANRVTIGATVTAPATYLDLPEVIPFANGFLAIARINASSTAAASKVLLAYLTIESGVLTLQDEQWVDMSTLTTQNIYDTRSSVATDINGDTFLCVSAKLGTAVASDVVCGICNISVSGNSIVQGDFNTIKNASAIRTRNVETTISSYPNGEIGIAYYSTSNVSSVAPFSKYIVPTGVQASQTKIDGLTAEEITTTATGDVWVLNTGA